MTPVDRELRTALDRAERQLADKYRRAGFNDYGDEPYKYEFFQKWLNMFWGIEVGERRVEVYYHVDGRRDETHYWPVKAVRDDERAVMFKLTYA